MISTDIESFPQYSTGNELGVKWDPVIANDVGDELPWPTVQADPMAILDSYGNTQHQAIFLDGAYAAWPDIDQRSLVWCGFPARSIMNAATFGNRRGTHAVPTEEMERPGLLSYNPVNYAFIRGFSHVPGVIALHREHLRRNYVAGGNTAYRVRRHSTFDEAVAGFLIVKQLTDVGQEASSGRQ